MNILIVNQSVYSRGYLIRLLSTMDFENPVYWQAKDYKEAKDTIKSQFIDLIITDLFVSPFLGLEFIDHVKKTSIPIVVITKHHDEISRALIAYKVHNYFSIPFKPSTLEDSLKTIIDNKRHPTFENHHSEAV